MGDVPELSRLLAVGVLSEVDVHLVRMIERLCGELTPEVALALALASQWPQRGHVCVDVRALAPDDLWDQQEAPSWLGEVRLPPPAEWVSQLEDCQAVGSPEVHAPFVLWQGRWLYLRRYWEYESTLEKRLRRWVEEGDVGHDRKRVQASAQRLFGRPLDDSDDQERAIRMATQQACAILTGGPGTGKTTTVVRMLALLLDLEPDLDICLAAPTGKAALRLQESIQQGCQAFEFDDALVAKLPEQAQTLHRLLGYQRHLTTFRHDEANPLPYGLVVVDEASMMDLGLAAKLLGALGPGTRLILVGDREQLPSVDAGAVFSGLCADACPLPKVELTRNYRFSQTAGIGALAGAIRAGAVDQACLVLNDAADETCLLEPLPSLNHLREAIWDVCEAYLRSLAKVMTPGEAFALWEHQRILCAHRVGPYGSENVNDLVHDLLGSRLQMPRSQRWYPGRPILITENDYAVELFNGDTGIVLPWQGKLHVFFRSANEAGYRHVPPARLPAHESAYAMTVHKSQGSEFDHVLLMLTDQPSRLLTRELLYTGITRARESVRLWGAEEVVRQGMAQPLARVSGLEARFESWEDCP